MSKGGDSVLENIEVVNGLNAKIANLEQKTQAHADEVRRGSKLMFKSSSTHAFSQEIRLNDAPSILKMHLSHALEAQPELLERLDYLLERHPLVVASANIIARSWRSSYFRGVARHFVLPDLYQRFGVPCKVVLHATLAFSRESATLLERVAHALYWKRYLDELHRRRLHERNAARAYQTSWRQYFAENEYRKMVMAIRYRERVLKRQILLHLSEYTTRMRFKESQISATQMLCGGSPQDVFSALFAVKQSENDAFYPSVPPVATGETPPRLHEILRACQQPFGGQGCRFVRSCWEVVFECSRSHIAPVGVQKGCARAKDGMV